MTMALLTATLLLVATLIGLWRAGRESGRQRVWLIAAQVACAIALYFTLYPPQQNGQSAILVVITPGASAAQLAALDAHDRIVSLPGTEASSSAERVPDLATALRRSRPAADLKLVGGGLPARDQDSARGRIRQFDAAALPSGIVELSTPPIVVAGGAWPIVGRVASVPGGRVELRDPGGKLIGSNMLAEDGRFALSARAKGEGNSLFELRVVSADDATVENLVLPLTARNGMPLRVLSLAGGADPELKYLRRWAVDAGMTVNSRIALGSGMYLKDGDTSLSAEALRQTDIVLIDERAWAALSKSDKALLTGALRDGLGLLLRINGPLPSAVVADWRALGIDLKAADVSQAIQLENADKAINNDLLLSRAALSADATDASTLLATVDGTPLALWRGEGRGRIAAWWLTDSYRLVLAGDAGRYGSLWSEAFAKVGRARDPASPMLPALARINERVVFCRVTDADAVEDSQARRFPLLIDDATKPSHCAAYWPAESGWQTLIAHAQRWPFYVRAAGEVPGLIAARNMNATQELARIAPDIGPGVLKSPSPRWPFFLAWLALGGLLWWMEKRARQ
jgi:hypothetical protein